MIASLARSLDSLLGWYLRRKLFGQRSHCTDNAALRALLVEANHESREIYRDPPPVLESDVFLERRDRVWGGDHYVFRLPSTRASHLQINEAVWGNIVLPTGHDFTGPMALLIHPWISPTGLSWLSKYGRPLLGRGIGIATFDLPHHGRRTHEENWSGELAFCGNLASMAEAGLQAVGDMRRVLAWLRTRGASNIGAMGYSLGGWGASMLAPAEPDLACILAGAPAVDVALTLRESVLAKGHIENDLRLSNLEEEVMLRFGRLISPLSYPSVVPPGRLLVAAPLHDAVIPPASFERLAAHWKCEIWRERHSHVSLFLSSRFKKRAVAWIAEKLGR